MQTPAVVVDPSVVMRTLADPTRRAIVSRLAEGECTVNQLAAPFDLPSDLYAAWKHVVSFRFDRKLSQ